MGGQLLHAPVSCFCESFFFNARQFIDYSAFKLSSPVTELQENTYYDVVVIGSGYGGSIAACRSAQAGKRVCVLERGKEWLPGEFPESELHSLKEVQITSEGHKHFAGDPTCLYDVVVGHDVAVLKGSGLGGTSLINANVALDADPRVFEDEVWPQALRDDLENVNGRDRSRFVEMMKPASYPDHFPTLTKLGAMETSAEYMIQDIEDLAIKDVFVKPPLYVNFAETQQNHAGVPQPACIGCGNCCSGCNTGAKNTLNLNYLQVAKSNGAQIFTETLVQSVTYEDYNCLWEIHIELHNQHHQTTSRTIRAGIVIFGAGSLGSTGILFKSVAAGLKVSSQLGERFSTNGDTVNFSYNGEKPTDSEAVEPRKLIKKSGKHGPGPCIAGVIDMRRREKKLEEGYVLQDGTPPTSVDVAYRFLLAVASIDTGIDTTPGMDDWREFARRLTGQAYHNSLAFLTMSQDDAKGQLVLDKTSGRVIVHYPGVGNEGNFETVLEGAKKATTGLKGTLVPNPFWRGLMAQIRHTHGVISVHPLGGCGMGESGETGVVDHAGRVFVGDTTDTYPGLLVVDGAIVPRCIGVNPTLTIGCLAERCMRLLAEDNGWNVA